MATSLRPSIAARVAAWLLVAVAVLSTADALSTLAVYHEAAHAADVAFRNTADGMWNQNTVRFVMRVHIFAGAVAAIVALAAALSVWRGNRVARILTIVFASTGIFCFGIGGAVHAGNFDHGVTSDDAVTVATERAAAAVPHWSTAVSVISTWASAVLLVAVIVLISIRAARPQPHQPVATAGP